MPASYQPTLADMKTPSFWYRKKGMRARVLSPIGQLYRAAGLVRRANATPYKASVPVICIGNIVAGGAGKTPTALALAKLLIKEGQHPVFVSRGYGGNEKGPLRVDEAKHSARDVGDEALLLSRAAPCWIARSRAEAIREAEKEASIIILDDGLQNPKVAADMNLLVIDGGAGLGNQCLIPAGPLRETMDDALSRITAIIMIGEDRFRCAQDLGKPVLQAALKPTLPSNLVANTKVLAFAGIGRPQKLYDSCRQAGLTILDTQDFPDHYMFSADDLADLKARADDQGLQLVTTSKDFVRLPSDFLAFVAVLDITLVFESPETIKERLLNPLLDQKQT
ncbi:MAG TPA: tetraacyldisaccharide 4'-kinase [Rhodospirillaceae bacterium]|nr:tetraacyldisaccharide 4'-kinase [Rhodospirillaceae bacterium]